MNNEIIQSLYTTNTLSSQDFITIYTQRTPLQEKELFSLARRVAQQHFGNKIYIRGLIEISSYCTNDCYYCGIRNSNAKAQRYRLRPQEILDCAAAGYFLGFRTFVLQGGEDPYYTTQRMVDIIRELKGNFPQAAVTLSLGERGLADYQAFRSAGADRYLLRHETACPRHYESLHPTPMTLLQRKKELEYLQKTGYQVGTGFMVGSPGQTPEHLAKDLAYLTQSSPQMVGIGPFIPHEDTPFGSAASGSVRDTLVLLAIIRLLLPKVLLPATTSLATLEEEGSLGGFLAGANVIMPNLSPKSVRGKYALYHKKKSTGSQAAESLAELNNAVKSIGYEIVVERGDAPECL